MDKKGKVLSTFGKVLPGLTDSELDRLLAFGEGMVFKAQQQKAVQQQARPAPPTFPPHGGPEGGPTPVASPAL